MTGWLILIILLGTKLRRACCGGFDCLRIAAYARMVEHFIGVCFEYTRYERGLSVPRGGTMDAQGH